MELNQTKTIYNTYTLSVPFTENEKIAFTAFLKDKGLKKGAYARLLILKDMGLINNEKQGEEK